MTTSEILLPDELDELRQGALLARVRLGLEANLSLPPSKLLAALDAYVSDYVSPPTEAADRSNAECDDPEEFIFECGCLWGEQLAQTLLWQWRRIHFGPREPEAIAVASADASLVVYPFQTIFLTANASCRCASPAVWLSFQNRDECQCSLPAGSKTSWTTSNDGRLQSCQADTTLYDINNRCPTADPNTLHHYPEFPS